MVARIGRINRDQRRFAKVDAPRRIEGLERLALRQHALGKFIGNGMVMNGDQRNIALVVHVAKPGPHPRQRQAPAMVFQDFRFDQFAVKRPVLIAAPHLQFIAGLRVHRNEPCPMALYQSVNAQHPL